MVRQVQLFLPKERSQEVIDLLATTRNVCGLVDFEGSKCTMVMFKSSEKHLGDTLRELARVGVGVEYGSIDIVALSSTKPLIASYAQRKKKGRLYKVTERMTVEEIFETVDGQSHLTFDFLCNIVVAAIIAGVGLLTSSSVTVVASMLISPLMGPIISLTFGYQIRDRIMVQRGLRNEAMGILMCLVIGGLIGLFYGLAGGAESIAAKRSDEMEARGSPIGLVWGFLVAAPSGVGVALGMTSGGINALVGVAISAALLPPLVNSGICLMLSAWNHTQGNKVTDSAAEASHFLGVAAFSALLFLMNFALIFSMALFVFKLKKVHPPATLASAWAPLPVRSDRSRPDEELGEGTYVTAHRRGPRAGFQFITSLFRQHNRSRVQAEDSEGGAAFSMSQQQMGSHTLLDDHEGEVSEESDTE